MSNVLPFKGFKEIGSEITPTTVDKPVVEEDKMNTIDVKEDVQEEKGEVEEKKIEDKPIEKPTKIPFKMFGELSGEHIGTTAMVIIPIVAAF